MFCSGCGNNVAPGERFCRVCGRDVSASLPTAPVASLAAGAPAETSWKAIVSLVSGILFFFFPASILAVVFGHLSLSDIHKSAGRLSGKGMAIVGLILGYLGIALIPLLILAAIAIPGLLSARIAANEASAVSSVRTIKTAEIAYSTSHAGYTCSLSDLSEWIDGELASGRKRGYVFELSGCTAGESGAMAKYQVMAYPMTQKTTGLRAFCSDESAVIKVEAKGSGQDCLESGSPLP